MKTAFAVALLVVATHSFAEDIDLFMAPPTVTSVDLPNVLFLIDNTGNWNTAFTNEKAALEDVFRNLPVDKFNVGFMMFGGPDVGYVRAAIRPMDATNKLLYADMVGNLDQVNDRESARTLSRTVSEAYRYLNGLQTTHSTTTTTTNTKRDYNGNTTGTAASKAVYALAGNALSSATATTYDNSTFNIAGCGGTYIVYIGNTVPSGNVVKDNNSRNASSGNELVAAGGDDTEIPLTYSSHQGNYADEWARFMSQSMGATFYTVDVDPTPLPGGHNNGMGNSTLLESMALQSGGRYFRVDSSVGGGAEISTALNTVFSEIQAVNSVFAAVALPANANSQSTFLNQIFIGMFRPDENAFPRWQGNLKQYKIGKAGSDIQLVDSDDAPAINSNTGFVTECARSLWTPTTTDSYWSAPLTPRGECLAVPNSDVSNSPDGSIVEKGAAAYLSRLSTSRNVYTCAPTTCGTLTDFDTTNTSITQALLGAANSTERDELISWARGLDIDDENLNSDKTTEMRSTTHADVIHSRPVAVNYGTDSSPQIVVFYGANDGMLRAINGNRSDAFGGFAPGQEIWAFMAPEFYGNVKALRSNSTKITLPATGTNAGSTASGQPKPYGMDGPISVWEGTIGGSDKIYLYATARRGSRLIHVFDVTTAATPSFLWRQGCPNLLNDTDCTTGWDDIGQIWSPPSITTVDGISAPVGIVGGGYDECEDFDGGTGNANHNCTSGSFKGNKIYVFDIQTGAKLKAFDTDRPVVGQITAVPVGETDRNIQYAYASDTGGNIYRISGINANAPIGSTAPASWTITKIASLGCGDTSTCTSNRKFLFGPDVVKPTVTGEFGIVIGSGDREKPVLDYGASQDVQNYLFSIVDDPTDWAWLTAESTTCDGNSIICVDSLTTVSAVSTTASTVNAKGFKLSLSTGEQAVTSALTVDNEAYFSTHIAPQPLVSGACGANLGTSTTYSINPQTAAGETVNIVGGGLPPSPVAGNVVLDDGTIVPFCIGCGGEGSAVGTKIIGGGSTTSQPKSRVYWNIQQ